LNENGGGGGKLLAALHPTGIRFDTEHPHDHNIAPAQTGNNSIKMKLKAKAKTIGPAILLIIAMVGVIIVLWIIFTKPAG